MNLILKIITQVADSQKLSRYLLVVLQMLNLPVSTFLALTTITFRKKLIYKQVWLLAYQETFQYFSNDR